MLGRYTTEACLKRISSRLFKSLLQGEETEQIAALCAVRIENKKWLATLWIWPLFEATFHTAGGIHFRVRMGTGLAPPLWSPTA